MRVDKKWFLLEYEKEIEDKFSIQASYLFDEYTNKVALYISLIQEWSAKGISKRRIQLALGISQNVHKACQIYFNEYKDALSNKDVVMDLIAQKKLIKAIDISPAQPKLIEMQLKRYDDEWVGKGVNENQLNIPTTIQIDVLDKRLSDKELAEYESNIKE